MYFSSYERNDHIFRSVLSKFSILVSSIKTVQKNLIIWKLLHFTLKFPMIDVKSSLTRSKDEHLIQLQEGEKNKMKKHLCWFNEEWWENIFMFRRRKQALCSSAWGLKIVLFKFSWNILKKFMEFYCVCA